MLTQIGIHDLAIDRTKASGEQKHLTMLVTSAGRRVALLQAFRRGAEALGVELDLLACDLEPELSAACHVADAAFAVPPVTDDNYVEAILAICRDSNVQLIVPTIDPELAPLASAHDRFAALGAHVSASAPAVIDIARDKLKTAGFFAAHDIPTPRTATLAEVRDNPESWIWPVLLKPRHGSSGRSVSIVESPAGLPLHEDEPMIVQALLRGEEWTVNIYIDDAGRLRAVVPHRRIKVRAGEVEKGVTRRAPRLIEIGERIAASLPGARGVLCYQAMVSPDGEANVFEINARFGGGYPLADHAGAAFARWLIEARLGMPSSAGNDWAEDVVMLRYDAAVFVQP
ncbi:ATP-grasp domain-containing protein [Sphingomonas sp. JC676]|uniref:ATP-grasp domain-containing protein n=1 Tax=Sphingomonas sp. JC676 TaxID=2768065 RepID=UPI00223BA6AD|nr:ATP-grasp domain-containing protein [Sphingomonas sp. JC676]